MTESARFNPIRGVMDSIGGVYEQAGRGIHIQISGSFWVDTQITKRPQIELDVARSLLAIIIENISSLEQASGQL